MLDISCIKFNGELPEEFEAYNAFVENIKAEEREKENTEEI